MKGYQQLLNLIAEMQTPPPEPVFIVAGFRLIVVALQAMEDRIAKLEAKP